MMILASLNAKVIRGKLLKTVFVQLASIHAINVKAQKTDA